MATVQSNMRFRRYSIAWSEGLRPAKEKLAKLRAEMHEALGGDGLFAEETAGLLNTWELSYLLSPGQRLFFLLPSRWTDAVLPLKLSVPADVMRVTVGRIELVTLRQKRTAQADRGYTRSRLDRRVPAAWATEARRPATRCVQRPGFGARQLVDAGRCRAVELSSVPRSGPLPHLTAFPLLLNSPSTCGGCSQMSESFSGGQDR